MKRSSSSMCGCDDKRARNDDDREDDDDDNDDEEQTCPVCNDPVTDEDVPVRTAFPVYSRETRSYVFPAPESPDDVYYRVHKACASRFCFFHHEVFESNEAKRRRIKCVVDGNDATHCGGDCLDLYIQSLSFENYGSLAYDVHPDTFFVERVEEYGDPDNAFVSQEDGSVTIPIYVCKNLCGTAIVRDLTSYYTKYGTCASCTVHELEKERERSVERAQHYRAQASCFYDLLSSETNLEVHFDDPGTSSSS